MTAQTVFVVDDDASICEAISNLLDSVDIHSRCYSSAEAFWKAWDQSQPGCLLLDARLPGVSGVEFQEQLRNQKIKFPIVFMTAHGDVPMVRKVMKAGAIEFLTKPFQKSELLKAVNQAFELDRIRRKEMEEQNAINADIESLTDREREVMSMVTAGLLNKQIAAELELSEITVKIHRRRVMEGMHAGSLAELVRMCERVKFQSRVRQG
jgi:FixJ family two-component response regulator